MAAIIKNSLGKIEIKYNVIAKVASQSVMETYGVVGLARKNMEGFFELLKKDMMADGVEIVDNEGKLTINLSVILEYGTGIATVSENIISTVKFNVEQETGLTIDQINVLVQDVRI